MKTAKKISLPFLLIALLLAMGCSNPYERNNPTDPSIVYKITFNAPDATSGTPPAALSGSYGDIIQLPTPQRTGYTFDGWVDNSSGTGAYYKTTYTITGDIALYAKWLQNYTVTFNANGATGGTAPAAMTAAANNSINLPEQGNLQKAGELFVGWNTNPSGEGSNYNAGSYYSVAGDIAFYAIFGVPCTISFNANGGGTAPESITAGSGASVTLPSITRNGYDFGGWNTNNSGTGDNYSGYYKVTGNVILYAKWSATPPGSIRVSNTASNLSIAKVVVTSSSGTTFGTYGSGGSYSLIPPNGSYTISNVPAGNYTVSATYSSSGSSTMLPKTASVTVKGGSTATVSFP